MLKIKKLISRHAVSSFFIKRLGKLQDKINKYNELPFLDANDHCELSYLHMCMYVLCDLRDRFYEEVCDEKKR